jgi:hypothetical protein
MILEPPHPIREMSDSLAEIPMTIKGGFSVTLSLSLSKSNFQVKSNQSLFIKKKSKATINYVPPH